MWSIQISLLTIIFILKKRFGESASNGAGDDKLKKRVERFGGSVENSNSPAADPERLKKRAERFSLGAANGNGDASVEVDEKVLKRKERFGPVTADSDDVSKMNERKIFFKLKSNFIAV